MAVVNVYKVSYHFEIGGKKAGEQYQHYIQAAAGDYTSLYSVISSNSKLRPSLGTLVFDSVQEVGHGDLAIA